jgi:hypothetical protein
LLEDIVGGDREWTSATIEEEDRALPRQSGVSITFDW